MTFTLDMFGLIKSKRSIKKVYIPEYNSWCAMRNRVLHPTHDWYHLYGGRGITICPRWMVFEYFLIDMGQKPSPKHQLERKDNDGHYELNNCVWATAKEQALNRPNRPKTYNKIQK